MADYVDVWAKVPFTYDSKVKDRGEIFKLTGKRNDEKLIGMRYVLPFEPKVHKQLMCDMCGRKFVAENFYGAHKAKKGGCEADSQTPTKAETAELIGVDVDKLIIDDETNTGQKVSDTDNYEVQR